MKIFDLKYDRPFRDEFQALCESIFDEGFLTNHKLVSEFEEQFAKFQNVKYSLAVSNGTSALELGLGILNVKNKEVLIPVNTFIATYLAVKKAGGIPVLCDIEPGYFSISAKEIEKKVTKNTAAIIVVHIGGHISPEVKLVKKLCKQHNLQLFEDAAHAHGATLDKVTAGNWGAMAAFSHFMTKVMTMGEGGSITFNDQEYKQFYEKAN